MLELDAIHSGYGAHQVLQGVSFKVEPGRITALLGRNGAGKTTCLGTIMGFVPPRSGSVRFMGDSLCGLAPHRIARRGIALVPQGKRLFPSLTVRETLTMAARPGEWTLARIHALFPVLERQAAVRSTALSGGEQQMLILGRALMTNPRLLLLDEPTEGLAPIIVQELATTIAGLARDGLSILLVEQNLPMALSIAGPLIVLSMGQVVYRGAAADLQRDADAQARHLGAAG